MKNKESRTRLFEVMSRLDKTFKPKLNEGNYSDLPAGAASDPYAPWNQGIPDYSLKHVDTRVGYPPNTFEVTAHSADGSGILRRDGFEMIDDDILGNDDYNDLSPETKAVVDYFEQFRNSNLTREIEKSNEFNQMGEKLWNIVYGNKDYEWEYPDNPDFIKSVNEMKEK